MLSLTFAGNTTVKQFSIFSGDAKGCESSLNRRYELREIFDLESKLCHPRPKAGAPVLNKVIFWIPGCDLRSCQGCRCFGIYLIMWSFKK
jgi:hypothetical protein